MDITEIKVDISMPKLLKQLGVIDEVNPDEWRLDYRNGKFQLVYSVAS